MKQAFFTLMALTLMALGALTAATGCSDDEASSTNTSTTGTGGAGGGGCSFDEMGGFGGFGDVCMDMAGDDECLTCTRGACCSELQTCETDPECSCLLACFLEGVDPVCCLTQCGNSDAVSGLIDCVSPNCSVCVQ